MKQLLFPLVIAMVITFAFGYFNDGSEYADLVLITLATFTAIAANVARQKAQKQYQRLQTQQDVI